MKRISVALAVAGLVAGARAELEFNAGADLRVRQEIMANVPGLPGGGHLAPVARGKDKNHMRFRPRVWGEIKGTTTDEATWRIYTRLTDEFRWYVNPGRPRPYAFPDEVILDNLFVEAKGLFDGFLDLTVGRQDMLLLYGLDRVFVDGTPGDGSRTTYTDMARVALNFDDDRRLDLFALYNFDDSGLRWGTRKGKHRSLSGFGGAYESDMDDWGVGAIWNDKLAENVPYQLFFIQKTTSAYHAKNAARTKHPSQRRDTLGVKVMPRIDEEWSLQLEAMGQVGRSSNGDMLYGASSYAGVNWTSAREGWKPFGKLGYEYKSGSKDGTNEGGHGTWDPLWARGAVESEMFLYGTHYGAGWWSNCHYPKLTLGVKSGARHQVKATLAPIFAAQQDELGGGDGLFKGFQSQIRYDFPIVQKKEGWLVDVYGQLLAEFFNPGSYYKTDKPAWFVRWQVEIAF